MNETITRNINFRLAKQSDVDRIFEMYQQNPDYDLELGRNTVEDSVALIDDKVYGYGLLKGFAEAVLVLDHSISKVTKARILDGLMKRAIDICRNMNIAELHTFSRDQKFAKLLIDNYDFQQIECTPLKLDLRK